MTQPEEARRPESEVNPYSAPSTPSETLARAPRNSSSHQRRKVLSSDLAGLAARFVGNLIDYTPFIIGYSAVAFAEATQVDISPWSVPVFVSCTVLFLAVQAFLVATRSQSIGKFCLAAPPALLTRF